MPKEQKEGNKLENQCKMKAAATKERLKMEAASNAKEKKAGLTHRNNLSHMKTFS
jgi:hypothetical protein